MPNILVRDLSEETVAILKKEAEANGRSLSAEIRVALDEAAQKIHLRPMDPKEWMEQVREYRKRFEGRDFDDPLDDSHIFEDFERGLRDL